MRNSNLGGPRRHPWTLYLSGLPLPTSEQEVKDVFEEHRTSITFVKLPFANNGPQRSQKPIAFVEFKDEESMQAALAKNAGKIRERFIRMSVADNRERTPSDDTTTVDAAGPDNNNVNGSGFSRGGSLSSRGSFRGRGGGRGGGGGGGALFAQAQRGLGGTIGRGGTRKGSDANGATSPSPSGPAE